MPPCGRPPSHPFIMSQGLALSEAETAEHRPAAALRLQSRRSVGARVAGVAAYPRIREPVVRAALALAEAGRGPQGPRQGWPRLAKAAEPSRKAAPPGPYGAAVFV